MWQDTLQEVCNFAFIDETNWEKECEREGQMNAHHGPFDDREQKSHCEMDFSNAPAIFAFELFCTLPQICFRPVDFDGK